MSTPFNIEAAAEVDNNDRDELSYSRGASSASSSSALSSSSSRTCTDCGSPFPINLWNCQRIRNDCDGCDSELCSKCYDTHPLVLPLDINDMDIDYENNGTSSSAAGQATSDDFSRVPIKKFCVACFRASSSLDFNRTYDTVGPSQLQSQTQSSTEQQQEQQQHYYYHPHPPPTPTHPPTAQEEVTTTTGEPSNGNNINNGRPEQGRGRGQRVPFSGITFVFAHGGGGSRAMFRVHAEELARRYGHRSILFDLPGHGTLVESPLCLETCKYELGRVMEENGITQTAIQYETDHNQKIIYVGGSFGAYVGFYLVAEFRNIFSGAIMLDCYGQHQTTTSTTSTSTTNTNSNSTTTLKSKMGLWLSSYIGRTQSNASHMQSMINTCLSPSSSIHPRYAQPSLTAGTFFDQVHAQDQLLKSIAPAEYIPGLPFPLLFMNGSKDSYSSNTSFHSNNDSDPSDPDHHPWLRLCSNQQLSQSKVYQGGDHFFTHDSRFVDDILKQFHSFASITSCTTQPPSTPY